jgi:hypothetical protein
MSSRSWRKIGAIDSVNAAEVECAYDALGHNTAPKPEP